jgi:hypothetical protein
MTDVVEVRPDALASEDLDAFLRALDATPSQATKRIFRPRWSPQILDEVRRNLLTRPELDPAAIDRRLDHLNQALPGALTSIPPPLIEAMPINEKDRHILALAVHVGAPTIVTENLRDFPPDLLDPFGVEAISPGEFALAQVDLHPQAALASIDAMAALTEHTR